MRFPEEPRKCVCFLAAESGGVRTWGGTGFLVSVKAQRTDSIDFCYFVTARHCIEEAEKRGDLVLRINTKDGGAESWRISTNWYYPEDDAVDIALIPFGPDVRVFDFKAVAESAFFTEETAINEGMGVGDHVYVPGLFTLHHGTDRNLPVLREGLLSAMPEEKYQDRKTGLMHDAYLVEMRSIGGLSGSPVFVFQRPPRLLSGKLHNSWHLALLGVMRGHFDLATGKEFDRSDIGPINTGMALVTPCDELKKLLSREDLVEQRRAIETEYLKESAATLD